MKINSESVRLGTGSLLGPLQVCGATEKQDEFSRYTPTVTGESYNWNSQKMKYCTPELAMLAGTPTGSYPGHSLEDWND